MGFCIEWYVSCRCQLRIIAKGCIRKKEWHLCHFLYQKSLNSRCFLMRKPKTESCCFLDSCIWYGKEWMDQLLAYCLRKPTNYLFCYKLTTQHWSSGKTEQSIDRTEKDTSWCILVTASNCRKNCNLQCSSFSIQAKTKNGVSEKLSPSVWSNSKVCGMLFLKAEVLNDIYKLCYIWCDF